MSRDMIDLAVMVARWGDVPTLAWVLELTCSLAKRRFTWVRTVWMEMPSVRATSS